MVFPKFITPVRKPVNRSGSHIIGKFPSLKLGRTVLFESTIERDLIYFLDFESSVSSFSEQPFTIEYLDDGKKRRYTPDFHAVVSGRGWVFECKPDDRVNDAENKRKFEAAREFCAYRGWYFRVLTNRDLRSGFRLRNIKLLRQFALCSVPPQVKGCILGALCGSPQPLTLLEITRNPVLTGYDARAAVLHMAFHRELDVPINDASVSGDTAVFIPGRMLEGGLL